MSRSTRSSATYEYDSGVDRIVDRCGVFIQMVTGTPHLRRPAFAYTVGLSAFEHPELLLFGSCPDCACAVLDELAARVRDGESLVPGAITHTDTSGLLLLELVPNPDAIALTALRFATRHATGPISLLQLTFPDRKGRFPTDPSYEPGGWQEPRPGEFTACE